MNVSKVKVSDEEKFLFLDMAIKANTKLVKERFGFFRVASVMVFQSEVRERAGRRYLKTLSAPTCLSWTSAVTCPRSAVVLWLGAWYLCCGFIAFLSFFTASHLRSRFVSPFAGSSSGRGPSATCLFSLSQGWAIGSGTARRGHRLRIVQRLARNENICE